ncbi:MAG: DNA mismatch repair endonuclease MutL [Holosporaceae bacterium]|jgi:DNA mismatch repair protein MutL|nr:DNA mismatch repair endonuclease MutL [Holosporaceae bacterium]
MTIRILTQDLINQIAAGEVIERPSSVIKELMENAIDAEASEISVRIINAGKSLISVNDNGIGMDKESLELCILSHATSKLTCENLFDIHTFGFRGEALSSITSIARVSLTSSNNFSSEAWKLSLEGSREMKLSPASRERGTSVEVRDLFFATPARLKFLKSDNFESDNCRNVFNRLALAFPKITFKLEEEKRSNLLYSGTNDWKDRILSVLGESFADNILEIKAQKRNLNLHGFIGIPTFNKASTSHQYFFVNNRPVNDRVFTYALKSAYSGLIPQGRYAVAVIFLDIPYDEVDVNVHPAKTEIRFKDSEEIRSFLISEFKKPILNLGSMKSSSGILDNFHFPEQNIPKDASLSKAVCSRNDSSMQNSFRNFTKKTTPTKPTEIFHSANEDFFQPKYTSEKISLGNALYQIGNTYVISENGESLIIVDQHAAAERITLEKLKNNLSLDSQAILMPEICKLSEFSIELLEKNKDLLLKFGIFYDLICKDTIVVNSLPAILGNCDAQALINDIVEELSAFGVCSTEEKINNILSTISCHGSLRAGKKLTIEEMNSLLRQMENTQNIAQCCHGRPSYVVLSMKILNNFFERC